MENLVYLSKAHENLLAAQLCHDNGLHNACANRAYYAMFQAAIAILMAQGFEFDQKKHFDHAQVQALFSNGLIHRRKIFQNKFKSYLYDGQIIRSQADYKPVLVSQKRAERQITRAHEFVDAIQKELRHDT